MSHCATCPFWDEFDKDKTEGACKFNPPRADREGVARWPVTKAEEWCGKHPEVASDARHRSR